MPTPTSDQIKIAASQNAQALAASLVTLLKLKQADARNFADKYAVSAVQWGVDLSAAKQAGDQESIDRLEEDFNELAIGAGAMAAELAIDAQAQTETTVKALLLMGINFSIAALAVA